MPSRALVHLAPASVTPAARDVPPFRRVIRAGPNVPFTLYASKEADESDSEDSLTDYESDSEPTRTAFATPPPPFRVIRAGPNGPVNFHASKEADDTDGEDSEDDSHWGSDEESDSELTAARILEAPPYRVIRKGPNGLLNLHASKEEPEIASQDSYYESDSDSTASVTPPADDSEYADDEFDLVSDDESDSEPTAFLTAPPPFRVIRPGPNAPVNFYASEDSDSEDSDDDF